MNEKERLATKVRDANYHMRAMELLVKDITDDHKRSIIEAENALSEYQECLYKELDENEKIDCALHYYASPSKFIRSVSDNLLKQYNCINGGRHNSITEQIIPFSIIYTFGTNEFRKSLGILHLLRPYELSSMICNEPMIGSSFIVMCSQGELHVSMNIDGTYWVIQDGTKIYSCQYENELVEYLYLFHRSGK